MIRPAGFVACGVALPVTVDGRDAYGLACGEHVQLTVPAGERILGVKSWTWFVTDENTTAIRATAGDRYYFRMDTPGLGPPVLNRTTPEAGRALVAKTTRLNP